MVLASPPEEPSTGLGLVLGSMLAPKVISSLTSNPKVQAATLVSRCPLKAARVLFRRSSTLEGVMPGMRPAVAVKAVATSVTSETPISEAVDLHTKPEQTAIKVVPE
jgi:hypothetical protein